MNEGINENNSEMFGPKVADKYLKVASSNEGYLLENQLFVKVLELAKIRYASAVTKDLDLGCDFQPCSAGHFLIMHPISLYHPIFLTEQSIARQALELLAGLFWPVKFFV